jgi:type IV pilus assembly protein PilC
MEAFQYKAVNSAGQTSRGRLDAVNIADLEMRLTRMGLDLVNFRQLKSRGRNVGGRSIKRVDLINFCFHLEQLARAGVPMLEGLADLRDSMDSPRLRDVTSAMIESIQGGKNLSQAMADFPYVFGNVFVNLIRAGEESGQLPEVLKQITENLKWQDEQAAHTKKLFMYPAFVGVVVTGVLFFLMIYLVPELLKFIKNMGQELPLHTKILIFVSNFFVDFWYVILLVPILAVVTVLVGVRVSPSFRLAFDDWKLRVPIVGPILKKIILTRFASYFSLMYTSGITVLDCIRICADIVDNKAVEEAVLNAGRQIADGAGIAASFASSGLFPPLVLRMLRVGENTGALETALVNVGYFYTRDVKESIERLQTIIEPAMTFILGGLLAWVMISVLGPIYDLITKIKI